MKSKNKNKIGPKEKAKQQQKASLKEKFVDMLELPKEIVLNIPKITIVGNGDMMIENYKNLIEYENTRIKINTGAGVVKISGAKLLIKEITSEDVIICGDINGLEFNK